MKKLFWVLLLWLIIFPSAVMASGGMSPCGGITMAHAATCTTSSDSVILNEMTGTPINSNSFNYYATKTVLSAATTITEYHMTACVYTQAGSAVIALHYDDAPNLRPGAEVSGAASASIANTTPVSCGTAASLSGTLSTPKANISAGTYWVILKVTGAQPGDWRAGYKALTGGRACSSGDGATWDCVDGYVYMFDLFGCQP